MPAHEPAHDFFKLLSYQHFCVTIRQVRIPPPRPAKPLELLGSKGFLLCLCKLQDLCFCTPEDHPYGCKTGCRGSTTFRGIALLYFDECWTTSDEPLRTFWPAPYSAKGSVIGTGLIVRKCIEGRERLLQEPENPELRFFPLFGQKIAILYKCGIIHLYFHNMTGSIPDQWPARWLYLQ